MSADTKIAELLTELHQLIKQTQVSYRGYTLMYSHAQSIQLTEQSVCVLSGGEVPQ